MPRIGGEQSLVCGQLQQRLEVGVVFSDDVLGVLHLHCVLAVEAIEVPAPHALAGALDLGL